MSTGIQKMKTLGANVGEASQDQMVLLRQTVDWVCERKSPALSGSIKYFSRGENLRAHPREATKAGAATGL